ncbi:MULTISPECIES: TerB N-terminal domain-containing protein [Acinetobacter]|uniref:tellurite resistance TerB family protein n=1 Tax=Acinetobacter TaxID=469 RepID=UPI002270978C|nr:MULTISPECIES: TerB N-terminal domain-containing protein [Acinetobacter]MDH2048341.1 TerB N-terminal domain-containing protein [Acinetobacter johnsonii]
MVFIASLVMGMFIIAFFSIIFYLIKPATFMFTLKRQSVGRLQIIGYWILYLFALLVLIGMFQSEGDSSSSLLGFFLGMTIQILLCIYSSKEKNNIKVIRKVVPPNLPVIYPSSLSELCSINRSEEQFTKLTSPNDIPIETESTSVLLAQTANQSEWKIVSSTSEVVDYEHIFITQQKQLESSVQGGSKQEEVLKKRETFEERQRLISALKTVLLLKQRKVFEERQRLISTLKIDLLLLKQQKLFEEKQSLISTLKLALLCLTQQRAFEATQRLQLIQTNTPVQDLLKEHKTSLEVESYQKNFESEQNISQSDSSQIGDEENFVTFQLEPKNDFNETIISLIPKVSHSILSSHEPEQSSKNLESNASVSQPELNQIGDEENFVTFQLESENHINEKIIPSAPEIYQQIDPVWVSSDKNVEINGFTIHGGMFYLGTKRQYISFNTEPSFIDVSLSISSRKVDIAERLIGYWPSYTHISPKARRAYLDWLAGGRSNPIADIGYVFLFFYGLERRALVDAQTDLQAKQEIPDIIKEVTRLLSIYGSNGSFKGYALRFIDYVSFDTVVAQSYLKQPSEILNTPYELPLSYRIALGQLVVDKYPLPVDWALAWVLIDRNISKRTPVTRCADYFAALFKQNYQATYGNGFVLSPNRTKLKLTYFPASSAISRNLSKNIDDLPDVSAVSKHIKKLQALVDQTTEQLEPYSRYLGRNPDSVSTSDVILFLPINLWPEKLIAVIEEFKEKTSQNPLAIELKTFLMKLGCNVLLSRNQFVELVRNLENIGLGIEPDIFIGSKALKPDELIVLFKIRNTNVNFRTEPAYHVANVTLDLASAVALADGKISEIELELLKRIIESWVHLSPEQHERLKAFLQLKIKQPSSLMSLKKKLELLSGENRRSIAQILVQLAQVDGVVEPAEVKLLERIYVVLQLEKQQVYKDLHVSSTNIQLQPTRNVFTTSDNATKFKLDVERIASLQKETALVSNLLANVFVDEAIQAETEIAIESEVDEQQNNHSLLGLDIDHSAFLHRLITRPQWSRDELLNLAADFDLMLDGALENINESALDNLGEQIIEGDDLLEVNQSLLEKIEI